MFEESEFTITFTEAELLGLLNAAEYAMENRATGVKDFETLMGATTKLNAQYITGKRLEGRRDV